MRLRRDKYVPLSIVFILTVVVSAAVEAKKRPNIIIIQPDDLPFQEGWSSPGFATDKPSIKNKFAIKSIERLRLNGLQMLQAYTASPVCASSRFTTMTGRYASRSLSNRQSARQNGTYEDIAEVSNANTSLSEMPNSYDCDANNIAAIFQRNGYRTGFSGKWHLTNLEYPDTEDYKLHQSILYNCGFDFADAIYVENFGKNATMPEVKHNMEWVTAEAINFINGNYNNNNASLPFFLYLNPTIPHDPSVLNSLQSDCLLTSGEPLKSYPQIKNMTVKDGVVKTCREYRDSVFKRMTDLHGAQLTPNNKEKVVGLIWLDDSIEAILQALIDNGQLEDTVILFQMDHGRGKGLLFETGVRIAQFIHYPAMFGTDGIKFDGMVSTIDIGPSMLHLAEIDISSDGYYGMDGKSWAEAVSPKNKKTKFKRCIFTEMNHDRAVRCGCHKLVKFDQSKYSKTIQKAPSYNFPTDDVMLFDLCDKSGNYISYPNLSSETINCYNTTCKDRVKPLTKILDCFIKKTSPKDEDFDRVCAYKKKPTFSPTTCVDLKQSGVKFDYTRFKSDGVTVKKERTGKKCRNLAKESGANIERSCDNDMVNEGLTVANYCKATCDNCGDDSAAPSISVTEPKCDATDNDKIKFDVNHSSGKDKGCKWLRNHLSKIVSCSEVGKGAYLNCKKTCESCD